MTPTMTRALTLDDVALFRLAPELADRVPWARLGHWPTPVQPLPGLPGARAAVFVKREDLSSPRYGGNKIRTLEPIMGRAVAAGAACIWATGAFGSNHATATAIHARHLGLEPGAALFPQPRSTPARHNLAAVVAQRPRARVLASVAELPLAMALLRRDPGAFVMAPGAASPRGALGALSAALELAEQVAAGHCPAPARIVVAAGSTCTTAGLLAGLHLAHALGVGFVRKIPAVHAVRVTPWPVTSPARIAHLARRTSRHVAELTGLPAAPWARLYRALTVDPRYFGHGYGRGTAAGCRALRAFAGAGGPPLDLVYSAKSAASLLDLARADHGGPLLFWATKSSAPLPRPRPDDLARAPRAWQRWLRGP